MQVRQGKYPRSDSAAAMAAGANCTAPPKKQIFRFNPGKQEKIFPPKHPYFPKGCGDCQYRKERKMLYTAVENSLRNGSPAKTAWPPT